MHLTVITAHGALGIWDEVVFVGVAAAFAIFMAVTWLRSRGVPEPEPPTEKAHYDSAPDRFRLD
ncbi:MAG: hypothetical protein ACUVSX_10240 [Aggregatilineales bacterium]